MLLDSNVVNFGLKYLVIIGLWWGVVVLLRVAYHKHPCSGVLGSFVVWLAVEKRRNGDGALFPQYWGKIDDNNEVVAVKKRRKSVPRIVMYFVIINVIYVTWGVLQERMMTVEYVDPHHLGNTSLKERFRESEFIVFSNRVHSVVLGGAGMMLTRLCSTSRNGELATAKMPPLYMYGYSSLSNLVSSWSQYEALKYLSFPLQVLLKTCKMVPVMLMGTIISKRKYSAWQYLAALGLTLGSFLFIFSNPSERDRTNMATANNDSSTVEEQTNMAYYITGWFLLMVYLVGDSFTSNWQGELFQRYPNLTSVQSMFYSSIIAICITSSSLSWKGFSYSFRFINRHPFFLYHLFITSICSSVGQVFIFKAIEDLGPLIFTAIMTGRQLITILFSCIIYRHSISLLGILGIIIIFTILFAQNLAWQRHHTK